MATRKGGPIERGSVLASVVLVLIALSLAAHGALLLARQELAASRAAGRLLQARVAADEALVRASAIIASGAWPDARVWGSADLGSGSNGAAAYRAVSTRLSRETWLLEGWGRVPPQGWSSRTGRLVWWLDPAARIAAFQGVVETSSGSPVVGEESIQGDYRFDRASPSCQPSKEVLDSVLVRFSLPPIHRMSVVDSSSPGLGRLGWVDLAEVLSSLPAGPATPQPTERLGECVTGDPWGWGDPDDPLGPCAASFVAGVAPADLDLDGGRGQGILVVRGDLEMAGTRFRGIVLVEGRLTVRQGASITGLSHAGDGVELDALSRIQGSACEAFRALTAARQPLGRVVELADLGPLVPP
jgi:hypothetical protein